MYTEVLVGSTREYWALTHNYDAQQSENIFGLKWMQHCDGVYSHEPKMMSVWWISCSGKLGCWAAFLLNCWASCLRFLRCSWSRSWGFYILNFNFSFIWKKNQQLIFHPELPFHFVTDPAQSCSKFSPFRPGRKSEINFSCNSSEIAICVIQY